jgi:hypothetical protein
VQEENKQENNDLNTRTHQGERNLSIENEEILGTALFRVRPKNIIEANHNGERGKNPTAAATTTTTRFLSLLKNQCLSSIAFYLLRRKEILFLIVVVRHSVCGYPLHIR